MIPIPGHDVASIALYDRVTGNFMTGDSLYPGRLYVPEAQFSLTLRARSEWWIS